MQLASPFHRRGRRAVALLAAGAAAAATAAAAPAPAQAAFSLDPCESTAQIFGRGASFSTVAFNSAFAPNFRTEGCPGFPQATQPQYNAGFPTSANNGSGNGRGAFGSGEGTVAPLNTAGQRDNDVRFAGSDEGPEQTRQLQMNTGNIDNAADDGKSHVIPAMAGAVTYVVNYPTWDADGDAATAAVTCPIPASYATGDAGNFNRMKAPNWRWERAWAGQYLTWGEFLADPDGAGNSDGGTDESGLDTTTVPDTDTVPDDATDEQARFDAQCKAKKLLRVVRQDNSGTTFAFKDFLDSAAQIDDANDAGAGSAVTGDGTKTDWKPGLTANPTDNRTWPSTPADNAPTQPAQFGDTAGGNNVCDATYIAGATTSPVCHSASSGGGAQRAVALANNGSIGYLVLADAVGDNRFSKANVATDSTFISPVAQRDSVTTYIEPAVTGASGTQQVGSTPNSTGGARCSDVDVANDPASTLTVGGWEPTSMVFPATGYGICSLSYALAWDDNKPVYVDGLGQPYAAEESKARVVKDFLTYAVSDQGQAKLAGQNYSPVPEDIQAKAIAGVNAIGWDKNATGNTDTGGNTGGNTNTGGTTNTGGGGTTPVTPPAAPPIAPPARAGAPTNAFTIPSTRTRGNDILASFRLPGPGRLVVSATGRYTQRATRRRGRSAQARRVTVGRASVNVTRAGDVQVRLPLSRAARTALRRTARMTVTVTATYTPVGGAPRTSTRTLSLRGRR